VLDGGMILYLDVLESPHEFRLVSRIGMRRPLYSTALGKALVAFLPEEERERVLDSLRFQLLTAHTISSLAELREELERTRREGYSIDDQENFLGARCIGAPILNWRQEALGSISIAGPVARISRDKIPVFAAAVRDAAQKISIRVGSPEPNPTPGS
jgi:IclR family KDG regulon transcriptional repressor